MKKAQREVAEYALKGASEPRKLLVQESEELRLNHQYRSLLEAFLPLAARQDSRKTPA
jgi:hypothetical protein